jgi:hypothetical protein
MIAVAMPEFVHDAQGAVLERALARANLRP